MMMIDDDDDDDDDDDEYSVCVCVRSFVRSYLIVSDSIMSINVTVRGG